MQLRKQRAQRAPQFMHPVSPGAWCVHHHGETLAQGTDNRSGWRTTRSYQLGVVQTATTRPTKLGQPFTRWSLRKLVAYLRKVHGRVIRIGREALRGLLARRGVTFQRPKTWKESPDPDREAKLDRIEEVLDRFPDRVFAFDEFGPLGFRPTAGSGWATQKHPGWLPATYHRTHGVRYFHGCYSSATTVCGAPTGAGRAPDTRWPR